MFDTGPVSVEGADRGEHAVAEGTKELERGSKAFWIWAPQGKGGLSPVYILSQFVLHSLHLNMKTSQEGA